ncbi:hypothetical protein D6D25_07221 [Aureobasidium pullulans]|nr:hypothetical protein D6D25_07221 [Aureobasidium pullulans]
MSSRDIKNLSCCCSSPIKDKDREATQELDFLSNLILTTPLIEYLRGTATSDECEPLFARYKQCLSRALKERGIDKMLDEARADNRENDLENMKPN